MSQALRVLIAEDNPLDAKLLLLELKRAGYSVDSKVVDSKSEFVKQLSDNWDIILADYRIPEFGALQALEVLKEAGLDIPFIIVSGTVGEEDAVAAMKLGATDYLLKDRLMRLGPAVHHALEQSRMRRERKLANEELREIQLRFLEVVQNIEEVFWMTNLEKDKVLFIRSNYEKMWGRTCESLYAHPMSWIDAIHETDRARVLKAATTPLTLYGCVEEYRIVRPDGSVRCISDRSFPVRNATGEVYRIAGVATDITERKQAEELSARLAAIVECSADAIIGMTTAGVITTWNQSAERLFGYEPDEIIGKSMLQMIPADRRFEEAEIIEKLMRGEYLPAFETKRLRQDGSSVDVSVSVSPIRDAAGRIIGASKIVRDISERKSAELATAALEGQLRQSQKMDAIGQLAGGVAHDFNNHLGVIMGYAVLLNEGLTDSKLRRFASNIITSAEHSADLTKKLLAFSRKGQMQTVAVSVHKILIDTKEMLGRSIDKRIAIILRLDAETDIILGDPSQIQNAFLNLGLNARDAMQRGGTLTFTTEVAAINPKSIPKYIGEAQPGDYLKICITDSGSGMTAEVQQHLFEPFFTTKPTGKGTGMGLASVFGTVKNHKGLIDVYSELGHGTTFKIHFPLDKSGKVDDAPLAVAAKVTGKLRILLVEDEDMLRSMFADMLSSNGHEVVEAENGRRAVDIYRHDWQRFDLVILDMIMPEMNGSDAFRAMKKINPKIKALLSSGFSANNDVQDSLDDGVKGFIQKPYAPNKLMALIKEIMKEE